MALQQTLQPKPGSDNDFPSWNAICHITYTRDTWVKLLQAPSVYAADEAKLLCQASNNSWVVWVPDHGEVVLDRSHFYC
ncbi:hypothetical protein IQ254_20215 [Nodosilinea sp. LEGE 07088]|uniref:hypothetical protein n=1 Tax=Nodosilinea sp. LEGE 07088 TaxID=2777968 RepID=UPI00187ECF45|nr:hypothetical protein [Nodosilinea sp. LEGE 07088]MBE9139494.1 hypothetical protein [Nodosilinea sp. LEGE 07088]